MHKNPFDYYHERCAALEPHGRMLDAGCGTGTWAFAAAPLADVVEGCDISAPRVALAAALAQRLGISNVRFQRGDVLALPYADSAGFDLVFCYGVVISYIPIEAALKEFYRVLRPGGRLYLCLNGIGWQMYLRDDESRPAAQRQKAKEGLYHTILHTRADVTPAAIRAGLPDRQLAELRMFVERECGADFGAVFDADVQKIRNGARHGFSFPKSGRGYAPEEVGDTLRAIGFHDYRWAPEGRLFPMAERLITRDRPYKGHLKTWEFVARK
jgi:SAM-dependent methyltransferase